MPLPWNKMLEMSDDELESHGLIRGLIVPPGEDPPAEWIAAHPHWIRIPYSMTVQLPVAAAPPAPEVAVPELPYWQRSHAPIDRAPPAAPELLPNPDAAATAARFGRPSYAPILRVSGTGTLPPVGRPPAPQMSAEAIGRAVELRPDLIRPVPFLDKNGRQILKNNGEPMMRPEGFDPYYFIAQGIRDKDKFRELVRNKPGDQTATRQLVIEMIGRLLHFGQGHGWDAQRLGRYRSDGVDKVNRGDFVDFATVAIGIYAASLGMSRVEILSMQAIYAALFSNFAEGTKFDSIYFTLPSRNVFNTDLGMRLVRERMIE